MSAYSVRRAGWDECQAMKGNGRRIVVAGVTFSECISGEYPRKRVLTGGRQAPSGAKDISDGSYPPHVGGAAPAESGDC